MKHSCNTHTRISGVVLIFCLRILSTFYNFWSKTFCENSMTKCAKQFFWLQLLKRFLPIFNFATTFFIYEMIEHASVTL